MFQDCINWQNIACLPAYGNSHMCLQNDIASISRTIMTLSFNFRIT